MSIDEKQLDETVTPQTQNEIAQATPNAAAPEAIQNVQPAGTESAQAPVEETRPRRRGFAAMDRDRVKQIASKGGRAAHAAGTAHQFSSDEARVAGKKGGEAPHVRRGGVRRRSTVESSGPTSQSRGQGDGR